MASSGHPKIHLDELEKTLDTVFLNIGSVFEEHHKARGPREERRQQRAAYEQQAASLEEARERRQRNENEEQREIDRDYERVAKCSARIEERVPPLLERWRVALDGLEGQIREKKHLRKTRALEELIGMNALERFAKVRQNVGGLEEGIPLTRRFSKIQAKAIMKVDLLQKRRRDAPPAVQQAMAIDANIQQSSLQSSFGKHTDTPAPSVPKETTVKPGAAPASEDTKRAVETTETGQTQNMKPAAVPIKNGEQDKKSSQTGADSKMDDAEKPLLSEKGGHDPGAMEIDTDNLPAESSKQINNSQQDSNTAPRNEVNQPVEKEPQNVPDTTAQLSTTAASQNASQTTTAKDSTTSTQDDTFSSLLPGLEMYANNSGSNGQSNSQNNEADDNPLGLSNTHPDSFTLDSNDAANDLFGDMNLNMDMNFSGEGDGGGLGDFGGTTGQDNSLDDLFSFDQGGDNAFGEGLNNGDGGEGNQGQQGQSGFDLFDDEFFNLNPTEDNK